MPIDNEEELNAQPINQPVQKTPLPVQEPITGEPSPIATEQPTPEPITVPENTGVQLSGGEPQEKEKIEEFIESNPQNASIAAEVLPDEGPMADLDKEAKQAIDGGPDKEVKDEAVDKAINAGLHYEDFFTDFLKQVEEGDPRTARSVFDSELDKLNLNPDERNEVYNSAVNSIAAGPGEAKKLELMADWLEQFRDSMDDVEYADLVEDAVELLGYTLKDNDKKTEAQIERFNDDPDLLIDRLRWKANWTSSKPTMSGNMDDIEELYSNGMLSEGKVKQIIQDSVNELRRKQAIARGAEEVKNEDPIKQEALNAAKEAVDKVVNDLFGFGKKKYTQDMAAGGIEEDTEFHVEASEDELRDYNRAIKEAWNKKSKEEKKAAIDEINKLISGLPQMYYKYGETATDKPGFKYDPPAINAPMLNEWEPYWEPLQIEDNRKAPHIPPTDDEFSWVIENLYPIKDLVEEEKEEEDDDDLPDIKWPSFKPGMGDIHSATPGGYDLSGPNKQPTFSAGAGLGKPAVSGGRNLSRSAHSHPMKASAANSRSVNNSGAARVADDVTAVKDYEGAATIKSKNVSRNVTRNGPNGGSSITSGKIEKSKGGKLIGVKGNKLPSGGGHTLGGTGKFDLPGRKSETKVDRDLNLMALETRILSAAKNWKLVKGFRDSGDELGAIRLLVEEQSNQIWVSSGITKGRAKLETAAKKDPNLIKYLNETLRSGSRG